MAIWRFSRTVREIERMRRFTEFEGELMVVMVIITGHSCLFVIQATSKADEGVVVET